MHKQELPDSKHFSFSISQREQMLPVLKALASPVRLEILEMLNSQSLNVNELAERLSLPLSTAAFNIRVLEEAGLITCEQHPGIRGMMKLCHRRVDTIGIDLVLPVENQYASLTLTLPVGCYSLAEDIAPTCGLASAQTSLGEDDNPRTFYYPGRFAAQLLWFRHGFVTYHFAVLSMRDIEVHWLELSFEACSEAPMYRDPWKSDINVAINDVPLGHWTSPCDYGGRRGLLTPEWWSDMSTQYGMLKTWRVDHQGTYLERTPVSRVTIEDLRLHEMPYITVRIGVSPTATHVGGLNLFGRGFGDFAQDIMLRIGYTVR